MNFSSALHEIALCGRSSCTDSTNGTFDVRHPASVRDDVYLPSHEAARLLPPDGYRDGERIVWDLTGLGAGRRSPGH
jgi:hypothetical protein